MDPGWSGQHFGNDGVVNVNSRLGKINIKMNNPILYFIHFTQSIQGVILSVLPPVYLQHTGVIHYCSVLPLAYLQHTGGYTFSTPTCVPTAYRAYTSLFSTPTCVPTAYRGLYVQCSHLCHYVSQRFDFLFKFLEFLVDHCTKDALDLTFLQRKIQIMKTNISGHH